MKILVADDSKMSLALITESLKHLGHEVTSVTSGEAAIESFNETRPDLIILDVIMTGMDGFECARRIREINTDDWIPIIFLSSAVDDENIAKGINAGGDDYLAKPFSELTLASKIKAMQRISDMRLKLYETTQKLSVLSSTDSLTGIYNRLEFDKNIKTKLAYAKQTNSMLALLFIDLDNFKTVNDSLGHYIGDILLKEVAKRLESCLKPMDFISRLGGDEFAIILSDIESPIVAGDTAQKIITALAPSYKIRGHDLHISSSIGIACYPSENSQADTIVQNADIAMYHAKELGRNNFQFFTQELNFQHNEQLSLKNALQFAQERHELFLHYQPVFNLKTKKISRIKAKLFWQHPQMGVIPETSFVHLAEELGLFDELGKWELKTIFELASEWSKAGYPIGRIALTILPRQLLQKNFLKTVTDLIEQTGISAKLVEFELTETSTLTYSNLSRDIIKQLSDMGISIVLNDFGKGYSSLNHLKSLPITAIKIDKSFIQKLPTDKMSCIIVKSIISLGYNLGFDVIALGIEQPEQLQFLLENNCPEGQGSLLTEPMNMEATTQFLQTQMRVVHIQK